nr:pentapeptide repeat-containing protein [Ktedonobacterales bacterium]
DEVTQRFREGLNLQGADLRQTKLGGLPLARVNLSNTHLEKTNFNQAHLERANFALSQLTGANFTKAWLFDASFRQAHLEDASFTEAQMESANLYQAQCRNASFYIAHLEGAYLGQANFAQATIRRAFVDAATSWNDAIVWDEQHVTASLADVRWNGANLATIDWSQVRMIGDEREAHQRTDRDGKPKTRQKWLDNYRRAVRANRQLAVALRSQGMNEEADMFAYRAQACQRKLARRQGRWGAYLGSAFLDFLAGYGYRPLRTLFVYLVVLIGYAGAFYSQSNGAISPLAAMIFSITSFHGRGFFPGGLALDDGITVVAATEAIVGLVIEVSFIATFTQRFFAR